MVNEGIKGSVVVFKVVEVVNLDVIEFDDME